MRIATVLVTAVVGLGVGLFCFWPRLPTSKMPTTTPNSVQPTADTTAPNRLLDPANFKSVFQTLENAKRELARSRMHVKYWGDPSSYETLRCLQFLDQLDTRLASLQSQIVRAGNKEAPPPTIDDLAQFDRLVDQYNADSSDFQKAARQKWGKLYKSD